MSLPVQGNVYTSSYYTSSYALQRPLVIVTPPPVEERVPRPQHLQDEGRGVQAFGEMKLYLHPEESRSQEEDGLPPPPPCSPHVPRPVTTHVLGVDSSNKLKYSMHINLGRLQQNLEQTERNAGVVEVPHGVLSKGGGRQRKEKMYRHSRTREEHSRTRRRTHDEHSRTHSMTQQSPGGKAEEEESGKGGVAEETAGQDMEVAGLAVAILPGEALPDLATSKRENVEMFRQAEREISKHLLRLKQPPPKNKKLSSGQEGMSKDDFVFTRVYGTMSLSVMRKMNSVHQTRKASEEHKERASKVAKVRRERVMRRGQIEAYQNHLRERVRLWKCEEDERLEQMREGLEKERQAKLRAQQEEQKAESVNVRKQRQEREFSSNFKQNSALISKTLSAEDRRASLSTTSATVRDKVQQVKQESWEQQEEVRRYLEQRRRKVLQDGREGKQEVDTRTLEVI